MSKHNGTFESRVRPLNTKPKEAAIIGLYKLRNEVAPSQYTRLIQAFQRAAPKHRHYVPFRLVEFKDLYWLPSASPLDLSGELKWAESWLAPAIARLTAHAKQVDVAEDLFNAGDLEGLGNLASQSIQVNGWSFWAASLQIGAEAALGKGIKSAEALEKQGFNRASGLLARMIRDRNDAAISYGNFESRCKDFIDRLDDDDRSALYRFRALAEFDDHNDMLRMLAADATSSYVDYYESIISVAIHALADSESEQIVRDVLDSLSNLELLGLVDIRIQRIRDRMERSKDFVAPFTGNAAQNLRVADRCSVMGSVTPASADGWLAKLHQHITEVEAKGLVATDDIDELLRISLNFQSLPSGRALWSKAFQTFVPVDHMPLVIPGFEAATAALSSYALLSYEDAQVEEALRASSHGRAVELCSALDNDAASLTVGVPDGFDLWLIRMLIRLQKFGTAQQLIEQVAAHPGIWARHARTLSVLAAFEDNQLESALFQSAELLALDSRASYELPLLLLFSRASSKQLANIPSWLVAFVAHYAYQLKPSSKLRVICRMACRRLYKDMHSVGVDPLLEAYPESTRAIVCAFLAIGWTDENLSMVEDMSTSQEVRRERIEVFQALITADPLRAERYSEDIQSLTLDETLWSGLRLIDSNRIFVNEPGITRWAEKELSAEYERWRSVRSSNVSVDLRSDQMLRSYLVDKDIEALLQSASSEGQSESGVVLLGIVAKLFTRFLLDPAHGLNSYLSLRVRHGTLRGTMLGPIEDERLLLSGDYSEAEFDTRWGTSLLLSPEEVLQLKSKLTEFGERLDRLAAWVVNEKVQISSSAKPGGLFPYRLEATPAVGILGLSDPSISFGFFLNQCYLAFWEILSPFRFDLAKFFLEEVDALMQASFTELVVDIESSFDLAKTRSIVTALKGLATQSSESCRLIAGWFVPEDAGNAESYPVTSAVAIAKKATSNVYRGFNSELNVVLRCGEDLNLSASGLSILYDALFVILSNAWIHSGLFDGLGIVNILLVFNSSTQVLTVRAENDLSVGRLNTLRNGQLAELHARYSRDVSLDLVPLEGGSGFPKLARIASAVDKAFIDEPLDFGITDDEKFYVELNIQLYARDGVFDAYL